MKKINNKNQQQPKELFSQMNYFVNHKERKVIFSEWFINKVKNISSEEYKTYLAVMQRAKGYEVIIKDLKLVPIYCA